MRESLKRSAAHSPADGFERYPKGSVVLCNACGLPIFKLDAGIAFGDKAGRMASAFKPLAAADLDDLAERPDVDAGVVAAVRSMSPERRAAHLASLHEVRAGDPMMCPACADCFVQVVSVEESEALDRSYTLELLTVPPRGAGKAAPVRGRRLGYDREWIH